MKTVAVAESFGMIIPVVAFMMNIFLTMRGNWNRFFASSPLTFVITGWAAYVIVSYQGTHQAFRAINMLTHFTQYVPGHAHLALLFFSASVIMGSMYYIIPRVYHCRLFSRRLAVVQYSVYFIGFVFFFGGFLLTGLVQGTNWVHQGLPVWSVLPGLRTYMALRAAGGILVVTSFVLFTYNILATVIRGEPASEPDFMARKLPIISADLKGGWRVRP
jgi:cbb3-type cytochrome oxidase subunit 1